MQDRTKEVAVRKVVVSEFVSLDGVMEDPSWEPPFRGELQEKFKFDELVAAAALCDASRVSRGSVADHAWRSATSRHENLRSIGPGQHEFVNGDYRESQQESVSDELE